MYSPGYAQSGNNIFNILQNLEFLKTKPISTSNRQRYRGAGPVIKKEEPMYGQLPSDYKRTELLAGGALPGQLPSDYKQTELAAGQLAEQHRAGAGFPAVAIVTGLDSNGQVDRTQSDEYKSIRAQYDDARRDLSEEEALAKGLELWAQANPQLVKTPTPNPLMEEFYPLPGPAAMAPDGVTVMGDLGSRAQSEGGYSLGMNSGDPLVQQEQQQAMTAGQANAATTAGTKSITRQAEEFLARRTGRA